MTFVERDPRAVALIESNLRHCGVTDRYAIIRADFDGTSTARSGAFDVVFLDPPYGAGELATALAAAEPLVGDDTLLVIEHAARDVSPEQSGRLHRSRELTSGDSALAFYARRTGTRNEAS